jgi:hypothetical protein
MPSTYELIGSTLTPTATSSVTFSSIPQTYTDLIVVASIKPNGNSIGVSYQFNNDTGANYSATAILQADGTAAFSSRDTNANGLTASWMGTATTNDNVIAEVRIYNYADTSTNKSTMSRSGTYTRGVVRIVGKYFGSTNAITTLKVLAGNNWAVGGSVALYGIKSA